MSLESMLHRRYSILFCLKSQIQSILDLKSEQKATILDQLFSEGQRITHVCQITVNLQSFNKCWLYSWNQTMIYVQPYFAKDAENNEMKVISSLTLRNCYSVPYHPNFMLEPVTFSSVSLRSCSLFMIFLVPSPSSFLSTNPHPI